MRATAFTVVLSMALLSTAALAEVPGLISYQGTLTDEYGVALDTTMSMTFTIYDDSTGGSTKWTETQPTVVVTNGIFNVLLGQVTGIPDTVFKDPQRWLGVTVGGDPELSPRQRIAAVGYAFRASEADTADYSRSGGGGGGGWVDDGTVVRLETATDSVGIGTTTPAAKLDVSGEVNTDSLYKIRGSAMLSAPGSYSVAVGGGAGHNSSGGYNTFVGTLAGVSNTGSSNTFLGCTAGLSNTTGEWNTCVGMNAGHDNSTGSGNVFLGYDAGYYEVGSNKLYIANSRDTSDVLIYGDFSTDKVGIGTLAPVERLHINQSSGSLGMRISSDASSYQYFNFGATNGYGIGCDNNDRFFLNREQPLGTGVLRVLTILSSGNVGVWTTSPARPLHVNDVIRLEPRADFPSSGSDGDLCVKGTAGSRHIYCYLNGDWRQLD